MRRWRNGAAVAIATLAFASVSCAGGGQEVQSGAGAQTGSPGGAQVLGASTTPGSVSSGGLRHELLEVAEVRPFQAFGFDIRQVPLVGADRWDVTALTGACGTRLQTPFAPGEDTRLFFSTVSLIVEASAPWDEGAKAFFADAQRDLRVGCPAFPDPAAFGAPVALTTSVDLGEVGTGRLGWTQTIAGAERTALRQVALVHDDQRLLMLAVITSPPTPPEHFASLAAVAFEPGGTANP